MSARLHAPIIGFAMAFLVACAHQEPTLTKADLAGFSMELGFGKEDLNSFEKLRLVFPCRLPIRMPSMAQYRTYNGYCGEPANDSERYPRRSQPRRG